MLASRLIPYFESKRNEAVGFDIVGLDKGDITDKEWLCRWLKTIKPDIFINCAGYTNVDDCEKNKKKVFEINGKAPAVLADICREKNIFLIHFSTDFVFDGKSPSAYKEEDKTNPLSVYGKSKLEADKAITESGCKYLIIRTSWLYGEDGKNFPFKIIKLAKSKDIIKVVSDQIGTPTYTEDLVLAVDNLLQCKAEGLFNFSNEGRCSWFEFAEKIISFYKRSGGEVKLKKIIPCAAQEYPTPAKRPAFSVLDKTKYKNFTKKDVPRWEESLEKFIGRHKDAALDYTD
jgi:dTDP-4-dehydrorhamnose reductase